MGAYLVGQMSGWSGFCFSLLVANRLSSHTHTHVFPIPPCLPRARRYYNYLPQNRDEAIAKLQELKDSQFIDERTRAVAVTFNVYNKANEMATTARFVIEFPPTGTMFVSYEMNAYSLQYYATK